MFVLALATQFALPIGHVQVVVHVTVTKPRVPQHRVEETLSWQQRVLEHFQQPCEAKQTGIPGTSSKGGKILPETNSSASGLATYWTKGLDKATQSLPPST